MNSNMNNNNGGGDQRRNSHLSYPFSNHTQPGANGQPTYPVQPRPGPYLSSNAPYSSPNYAQQQQGQPAQMQSHQRRDSSHFQPLPSMYPGAMPSYSNQQPPRSAQSLAYISTHNVGMMQGAYGSSHPVQGGSQSMYATSGQTSSSKSPPPKSPSDRYGCEYCSASFTRAHDRKRHYASAHDDKPSTHVCKHCGKSFSRDDSLKRHKDNGPCGPA